MSALRQKRTFGSATSARVLLGIVVNADEASGWNDLASKYDMKRINHAETYSTG
jgi:hypothetical protein